MLSELTPPYMRAYTHSFEFPRYITRIHCDYEHVYQLARYMPRVLGAFCKVERAFIRGGALDAQEGFRDSLRPDKVCVSSPIFDI